MKRITANQYKTSERYYKLPKILWNLVRKLNIRVALTSVLFALAHHPGIILAWCLYAFTWDVFRACTLQIGLMGQYGATFSVEPTSL